MSATAFIASLLALLPTLIRGQVSTQLSPEEIDKLNEQYGNMTCCVISEGPYVIIRGDSIHGVAIDNFQLITKEMKLRFDIDVRCSNLEQYHNEEDPNRSEYNAAINEMDECAVNGSTVDCRCDMFLSLFTINHERFKKVDMISLVSTRFEFVTSVRKLKAEGAEYDFSFIVKPFAWDVWGCTIGLMVSSVVTFYLVLHANAEDQNKPTPEQHEDQNKPTPEQHNARRAFIEAFNAGLGETPEKTFSSWLMYFTQVVCLISGIFMLSVYNSAVTGNILELKYRSPIRGIRDFQNCHESLNRIAVLNNSANDFYLKAFVENEYCQQKKNASKVLVNTHQEGFGLVIADNNVDYFFSFASLVDYEIRENYCGKLDRVGEPFFEQNIGYVLAQNSPLTHLMDEAILILRQKNALKTAQEEGQDCNFRPNKPQVTTRQLSLFFIIAFATLGAILVSILFKKRREIVEWFRQLPRKIVNWLRQLPRKIADWFRQLRQGSGATNPEPTDT